MRKVKFNMGRDQKDKTLDALDEILPLEEGRHRLRRAVAQDTLTTTLFFCAPVIVVAIVWRAYFTHDISPLPFVFVEILFGAVLFWNLERISTNFLCGSVTLMWISGVGAAFVVRASAPAGAYFVAPAVMLSIILSGARVEKITSSQVALPVLTSFAVSVFGVLANNIEMSAEWFGRSGWSISFFSIALSTFFIQRTMVSLVAVLRRQDRLARLTFYKSMGAVASLRDYETGAHMRRCALYAEVIAARDPNGPFFGSGSGDITALELAIPLHDIGKLGIPDAILLKAGKLSDAEFEVMKRHTLIGWDLIRTWRDQVGMDHDMVLALAENIAIAHHENWDGSGYPFGLKKYDIPYEARVMSIIDVYDALRSPRIYKKGLRHEEALLVMEGLSEQKFDPTLFSIFKANEVEFARIYELNSDRSDEKMLSLSGIQLS